MAERYLDLVAAELEGLAATVIEAAGVPTEPFGVYFFHPSEPGAALARAVEYDVFDEWFGNSPELLDAEYRPYLDASVLIVVLDHRRRVPVGACRLTMPSPAGLKTLHDVEQVWHADPRSVIAAMDVDWDDAVVWDAVTWAVARDYRGKASDGLISMTMLSAGARLLRMCGGRIFTAVLDVKVLEMFAGVFPGGWVPFPGLEPTRYLDSPLSIPAFVDMDEFEPRLAAIDAGLHAIMYRGEGTEAVMRQPDFAPILLKIGRTVPSGIS